MHLLFNLILLQTSTNDFKSPLLNWRANNCKNWQTAEVIEKKIKTRAERKEESMKKRGDIGKGKTRGGNCMQILFVEKYFFHLTLHGMCRKVRNIDQIPYFQKKVASHHHRNKTYWKLRCGNYFKSDMQAMG